MNNQHNAPGEQGVETVPGDPGMIQDLLRAVIAMSDRLKHLEGVMFGQKQPQSPPVADKPGDRGATPQDISFPGFIKDEFRADLKKNPAQAMINLTADIANRQKGADSPGILPEKYAEEIIKLSRAMRKNKLLSDFEDARELIKEIEKDNIGGIKDELGDVLLQVVFHSQIEKEKGNFGIDDVIDSICKKMIRRHPHVFGNLKVKDEKEVEKKWEEIKRKEKRNDF